MSLDKSRFQRLAGISTILSLIACYGTLALVAVLGMLGFAVAINNTVWAGAIMLFASLALIGLGLSLRRHRTLWPMLLGAVGLIILGYTMYVDYSRATEIIGFIFIAAGVIWNWRIRGGFNNTANN